MGSASACRTGRDLYALAIGADTGPVQLTRHRAFDDAAAFSPNGERLAFVSTRDGNADIFVTPFDPADPAAAEAAATNLTRRIGGDFNPSFSPDGNRIAYSRQDTPFPLPPPDTTNTHTHALQTVKGHRMTAEGRCVPTATCSANLRFLVESRV